MKNYKRLIFLLLLMPSVIFASYYLDPTEAYTSGVFMAVGVSALIYLIIALVLRAMNKLNEFYKIPVFIILMVSGVLTVIEVGMALLMAHYPGSILIGSLSASAIFIWFVKSQSKGQNVEDEVSNDVK